MLRAVGGTSGSTRGTEDLQEGFNTVNGIVFDASGNPYIFGTAAGTNFLGTAIAAPVFTASVLARVNPLTGALVWTQIIEGNEIENGMSLRNDSSGNLYVIGKFSSTSLSFPTSPLPTVFSNPEGNTDTFVAKYNSSGVVQWARQIGGTQEVASTGIDVSQTGDVYVTGEFLGTVSFPTTPNPTVLTENESGTGDASFGGFIAKMDTNGNWQWAKGFGGLGEGIALGGGNVFVVGTFWDGGIFGEGTPNEEILPSFVGQDQFIAAFETNGNFVWAKPIAGNGIESENIIGAQTLGGDYKPIGVALNPADGDIYVSGDFSGVMSFDCTTLQTPSAARHSFVAKISTNPGTCRIWNGLDVDDNNWDSADNWNGDTVPSVGDSVHIPYTGNSFDNPIYNPMMPSGLSKLSVSDDRTLTLQEDLSVEDNFWLVGGFVNTGTKKLIIEDFAASNRVADNAGEGGFVRGNWQKNFGENGNSSVYTFHLGAGNNYLPLQVSLPPLNSESISASLVNGIEPNLPNQANALNKYWSLSRTQNFPVNLLFKYNDADVTGSENGFRLFRISGGVATPQNSAIVNTAANTASIAGVVNFSDWTLGALGPTSAQVDVGGRIMRADGTGIGKATITLTDEAGNTRTTRSSSFGYYKFTEIPAGQNYVVAVSRKGYEFTPQTVSINTARDDLNFVAE